MDQSEFNIQREEGSLFSTLIFSIPNKQLNTSIPALLEYVINTYSIIETSIVDIHISRTRKNAQNLFSLVIKYCNFNLSELQSLKEADKIRFVLNLMGYSDSNIKSISYKKYWANSDKLVWVATVYDSNYDFDADESYCARDYEVRIRSDIKNAIGLSVIVDFI